MQSSYHGPPVSIFPVRHRPPLPSREPQLDALASALQEARLIRQRLDPQPAAQLYYTGVAFDGESYRVDNTALVGDSEHRTALRSAASALELSSQAAPIGVSSNDFTAPPAPTRGSLSTVPDEPAVAVLSASATVSPGRGFPALETLQAAISPPRKELQAKDANTAEIKFLGCSPPYSDAAEGVFRVRAVHHSSDRVSTPPALAAIATASADSTTAAAFVAARQAQTPLAHPLPQHRLQRLLEHEQRIQGASPMARAHVPLPLAMRASIRAAQEEHDQTQEEHES